MTRATVSMAATAFAAAVLTISGPLLPAFAQSPAAKEQMQKVLSQPVEDYQAREQTATPSIRERLAALRRKLEAEHATFEVGYTTALELPLSQLAGTRVPARPNVAPAVNERAQQLLRIDREAAEKANIDLQRFFCRPDAASFDWRTLNKVTPVKSQVCGTCWDFTAMGAYEGSYAVRNNQLVDTSEQYILNCANAGSCQGGWWMPVFDFLIQHGDASEANDPFTGNDQLACPTGLQTRFRASAWGFVANNQSSIPPVADIKKALCEHGPLATAVYVDPAFQAYTGGVFDEHTQQFKDPVNHGIVIIGWDDAKKAWLIKNSWGPGWGETGGQGSSKGFMWIAYNTNEIGVATAWVDAMNPLYTLPPRWLEVFRSFKIKSPPLPMVKRQ